MINHSGQHRALKTWSPGYMGLLLVLEGFCSLALVTSADFLGEWLFSPHNKIVQHSTRQKKNTSFYSLCDCVPPSPPRAPLSDSEGARCAVLICVHVCACVHVFIGSVFSALPPAECPGWGLLPLCQSDFSHPWAQVPLHFLRGYDGGNGADLLAANVGWGKWIS